MTGNGNADADGDGDGDGNGNGNGNGDGNGSEPQGAPHDPRPRRPGLGGEAGVRSERIIAPFEHGGYPSRRYRENSIALRLGPLGVDKLTSAGRLRALATIKLPTEVVEAPLWQGGRSAVYPR